MLSPEEVQNMIAAIAKCEHISVEGDGHHFFAHIVSSDFEGKGRLARHRLIKDGLAENWPATSYTHFLLLPRQLQPNGQLNKYQQSNKYLNAL